jgi:hypothetical protein
MARSLMVLVAVALLSGCGGAKDTPLPRELDKMDSLKPVMEKLTPEERELLAGYVMRTTIGSKMGALFGGKEGAGVPEGMTVGRAIEEQRKFKAEAALEEAKQAAVKAKLQAERDAAMKQMRDAVTVTLVSKKIVDERGMSGMLLDEHLPSGNVWIQEQH